MTEFNPREHLMMIGKGADAKEYLPVQWRLVWFRSVYPQGTIETEELVVDIDKEITVERKIWDNSTRKMVPTMVMGRGYARFKAIVSTGLGGRASGTKTETGADFPDYAEKAETGAIGRALAALGFGTQFAPELDEEQRVVDAPVTTPHSQTRPEPAITDEQYAAIMKACHELGRLQPDSLRSMAASDAATLLAHLTEEHKLIAIAKRAWLALHAEPLATAKERWHAYLVRLFGGVPVVFGQEQLDAINADLGKQKAAS